MYTTIVGVQVVPVIWLRENVKYISENTKCAYVVLQTRVRIRKHVDFNPRIRFGCKRTHRRKSNLLQFVGGSKNGFSMYRMATKPSFGLFPSTLHLAVSLTISEKSRRTRMLLPLELAPGFRIHIL